MTTTAGRSDRAAGLPAGWAADPIQAGFLLYDRPPSPELRDEMSRIPGDPSRPILAVQGSGSRGAALEAAAAALAAMPALGRPEPGDGPRPVRLLLPELAPRHAQRLAERHSLDLIATSGLLKVHPAQVVTWGFSENKPAAYWQWHRYVPGGRPRPAGAVYPSPRWDTALAGADTEIPLRGLGMTAGRIAAGLTVYQDESSAVGFLRRAAGLRPDPERPTVAIAPTVAGSAVPAVLESLLGTLPAAAARSLRVAWPGAMSGGTRPGLAELCRRHGVEIVAPDTALVQDPGSGALLAWGPRGLGRWLRMSSGGHVEPLGPLHPAPRWQPLARATSIRYSGEAGLDEVPAGLRLRCSDDPATARLTASVPPDEARVTLFADGDAARAGDRAVLERLLDQLPASLARSFRLVMRGAAAGGPRAYGQWLANRYGAHVTVADGAPGDPTRWTDFRLEESPAFPPARLPAPASDHEQASEPAPLMAVLPPSPRPQDVLVAGRHREREAPPVAGRPREREASPVAGRTREREAPPAPVEAPPRVAVPPPMTAPPVTQSRSPDPVPRAQTAPSPPERASASASVPVRALFPRGHRSTAEERRRFREGGGTRRDTHQAVVSRLLTERPALRGALSREPADAIATDLSALRAYLSGDLPDLDAALRSGEPGGRAAEAACVISALRLLAADRGPVFLTADLGGPRAAGYVPGQVLVEPAFVRATGRPPARRGDTLFAVWSRTARRIGLLDAGDDPGEVLFAAGSLFAVLAVDQGARRVVYLDERIRADAPAELAQSGPATLERLRAAVAGHPEPPAPDAPAADGFALCLDDAGRRFTSARISTDQHP
ncbi:hypothetical protein [Actinomadura decatromicini]|uniref:Uncharacterized protein n=1 Tax=Actinomadura decatromicini TaxID=2604572 RepID=A0A5D3F440_9ACTN|nr:hypothetical protein [Actinomadura decatromicini]TYK43061.1 hypothetical protein FXF68_39975 [Actinomadura decatromicini]